MPKLVMHSHNTLALHSQNIASAFGLEEPGATLLAALPFCGVFGLNPVLGALAASSTVVVMDAFESEDAVRLIEQHHVSHLFGSDEMFRRLLSATRKPGAFGSLVCCGFAAFSSGAQQLVNEARERGIPLVGLYGSSEVQALFSLQSRDAQPESSAVGGGFPASTEAQVRVRNLESGRLNDIDESGLLEISAPTNFLGYFGASQATKDAIDDEGFFRTGDVGYLRSDGSFVYQTRQGDSIRLSGFLVNPAEIEDVIRGYSGVSEVQVIGVDSGREAVCVAFVIPESGKELSESEMLSYLHNEIAKFKIPKRIWTVDHFPITESANGNKIQRGRLREIAAERLALD